MDISALNIIATFTKKEQKEFELFLESPLYASRKKIKLLYKILDRDYLSQNKSSINKEKVYEELFSKEGKAEYNDATMRNYLYELQQYADKFLIFKSLENDITLYNKMKRKEYRERKLDKLYIKALLDSEKDLDKVTKLSSENYLNKYEVTLERKNFESMYSDFLIKRNKKVGIDDIDEAAKNLTFYYILELLYLRDGSEKYSKRFDNTLELSFLYKLAERINLEEFIAFLKNESGQTDSAKLFEMYERFFKLFNESDLKEYNSLKTFILQNVGILDTNLRSHLFFQLVKYSSINSTSEDHGEEFSKELFKIFKLMIDNGYHEHTEGTYFQIDLFRVVFLMGYDYKDIDWTENFVVNFASKLPLEFQKTALNCGLAYINFAKGDYDRSLDCLNKMTDEYFNLEIDKKLLSIMIFFETGSFEQAVSLTNSMQKYIDESKKVSFTLKEKINNFLKFILKLIKETERSGKADFDGLKFEIEKETQLRERKWLLEKAS